MPVPTAQLHPPLPASLDVAGKLDRTVPGDDGKPEPILKFLNKHAAEIKRGKFSSPNPKDDNKTITIDLVTSKAQRGGAMRDFVQQSSDSPDADFSNMLKELAKMADKIVEIQTERLTPPDSEYRYLRHMGHCLDLRKMAFDSTYGSTQQAVTSLQVISFTGFILQAYF